MIEKFKKILIIKWGALGDIIAAFPAMNVVRDMLPNSEISVLSNSLFSDLASPGKFYDKFIDINKFNNFSLIRFLRKEKYDLAINLRWTSERCAWISFLSGAKFRVSSGPPKAMFLYNIQIPHPKGRYHEIHRNLDIIKVAGFKVSEIKYNIRVDSESENKTEKYFIQNNLKEKKILGIHPGASKNSKAWSIDSYIQVAQKFVSECDGSIVVTYGINELRLAKRIVEELGKNVYLSPITEKICDLVSVVKRCNLYLCNNSGPMNVAMALNVPIVAILGSTHPNDWRPYGEIHRTIKSPIYLESFSEDDELKAMKAITVDYVWNTLKKRWLELMNS